MSKIAIYGGTFDPIHHAHLLLAREALEVLRLDEVIFVPAAESPHKTNATAAPADARLEMLRAAIAREPNFCVDDLELNRPPPSYTFDTVERVCQRAPDAELLLLIGEDHVVKLSSWHRFDELRRMVEFVVLERTGQVTPHAYRTIPRRLDISASDIRKRVARGASIRYLVPPAVEAIIHARGLYQEP